MKEAAIKSIMLKNLKSYQIFTKLRGDLGLGKESLHWKFQPNHFTYVGESVGELVGRGVQLRFWQMKSNFLRDLNLYIWKRIDTQKKHVVLIFFIKWHFDAQKQGKNTPYTLSPAPHFRNHVISNVLFLNYHRKLVPC